MCLSCAWYYLCPGNPWSQQPRHGAVLNLYVSPPVKPGVELCWAALGSCWARSLQTMPTRVPLGERDPAPHKHWEPGRCRARPYSTLPSHAGIPNLISCFWKEEASRFQRCPDRVEGPSCPGNTRLFHDIGKNSMKDDPEGCNPRHSWPRTQNSGTQ